MIRVGAPAAILVVEGETDQRWLQLAAARAGRADLLEGLEIVEAGDGTPAGGGSTMAIVRALVLQATTSAPVGVLLDNDEEGREGLAFLRRVNEKTRMWKEGKTIFTYRMAIEHGDGQFPYEAEDLWPAHLHRDFCEIEGEEQVVTELRARPRPQGGFHYGYRPTAKPAFARFIDDHATADDCEAWVTLLELVRHGLGL